MGGKEASRGSEGERECGIILGGLGIGGHSNTVRVVCIVGVVCTVGRAEFAQA